MHNAHLLKIKNESEAKRFADFLSEKEDGQVLFFRFDTLKIDDARALQNKLYQSLSDTRSFYVVFFALAPAVAQNALLKVLEELPAQNEIYILTPNPRALLDTVRSRLIFENFETQGFVSREKYEEYLKLSVSARLDYLNKMHEKGPEEELAFLAFLEGEYSKRMKEGKLDLEAAERLLAYKKALAENIQPLKALRESLAFAEL